jgi:DNA-directed RNA polymerase subunit RPC12/RpoP
LAAAVPQRAYRAPCPGCGAPVDFRSAQSTHAVCAYCHSTIVRSGEVLSRIGRMAELFDDHSPLQLMATGAYAGQPFTLVGRLQYRSDAGTWNEWHAAMADGSSALLAEDNGAYVFARPVALPIGAPPPEALRLGARTAVDGRGYGVAFQGLVTLIAAEGELSHIAPLGQPFPSAELRGDDGSVLSLDYFCDPPDVSRGEAVLLETLKLGGLCEASEKAEAARQFNCPNCGAPVAVQLQDSKAITCPSCRSIIDLTSGLGGELRHALQDEPIRPLIPLGAVGRLQGADWQVVGFQHRMGREAGDDESFGWSEYLLYHRQRGFCFLVDAEDGWSLVKAATGAPRLSSDQNTATYLGSAYSLLYRYDAETIYVQGEFYWPVERGQKTSNADYAYSRQLLSMERSRSEVTWSMGNGMEAATVAAAFGLPEEKKRLMARGEAWLGSGIGRAGVMLVLCVLLMLFLLFCL